VSQQKAVGKKTTHSGRIITYTVQYDELRSNISFSVPTQTVQAGPRPRTQSQSSCTCQKEKSKTTDRAEVAGTHARNDRREFPPPSHQDSGCRTAQAPRVRRRLHKTSPEGPHGQPNPHLHWTRTRQPSFFFFKMPETVFVVWYRKSIKTRRAGQKAGGKKPGNL
jgi:hypothetical protein